MGWILYFISILDVLHGIFLTFSAVVFSVSFTTFFICLFCEGWDRPELGRILLPSVKKMSIISGIVLLLSCFIPDSKSMYINFALTNFVKSDIYDKANSVTIKALTLLEKKLDYYINDENMQETTAVIK